MPALLIISQVYPPDPAAVGQYLEDEARARVRDGWSVTVITANRGYDDPSVVYPRREERHGVRVIRLGGSSWGKASLLRRLLGQFFFLIQAVLKAGVGRRYDHVLVSTSPPMAGLAGVALRRLRGTPFTWWVMDLNPDQAVALGAFRPDHPLARLFDGFNEATLRLAARVVTLDRFMAARLEAKYPPAAERIGVVPPWPLEGLEDAVPPAENPFRHAHGMDGRRVLAYSGNHSVAHPLTTLLDAIDRCREDDRLCFAFIGGGKGKAEVEARAKASGWSEVRVKLLPYQPLDQLRYSLSAGDVHVVSMGERMVGCVHPCKFYGALALGRPILYLGPQASHIGECISREAIGWQCDHGDVDRMESIIQEIAALPEERLATMGENARRLVRERFVRQAII